jgi:hypothetical protein
MKHVFIRDGVVTDIARVDPFSIFSPAYAAQFVEAPDEVEQFWVWDGSTFAPPPPPPDLTAQEVRAQRNTRLTASDWSQLPDAPVDQAAWAAYRQALRDIPSQAGFPWDVEWPVQP